MAGVLKGMFSGIAGAAAHPEGEYEEIELEQEEGEMDT